MVAAARLVKESVANQTLLFEELEDSLKSAIELAGKVHINVPLAKYPRDMYAAIVGTQRSWDSVESLRDYLHAALTEVRGRLNVLYAQEIRKQRGRE